MVKGSSRDLPDTVLGWLKGKHKAKKKQ